MHILRTLAEAAAYRASLRANESLALVPTMGFLHSGHESLMREARRRAQHVAATLFVNPTQFGPNEDLSRYPRDFEGDRQKCEQAGVDVLFAPSESEMYPTGYQTFVTVEGLDEGLCGARRPGHFRGVATIVTRLFCLFRPTLAFFGEKDFQQLQVIKALAKDLHLGVEVVGMPTIREADGLAKSSRNSYLSPTERHQAVALSKALAGAQKLAAEGETSAEKIIAHAREIFERAHVREDYIELVHAQTLKPVTALTPGIQTRLMLAGFVGKTRLIDNGPLGG